jgi:symplekin
MFNQSPRRNVDTLSAIINSWGSLTKVRPLLLPLIISTLSTWTPRQLEGFPASSIKSIEKSVRIMLIHISRYVHMQPHTAPKLKPSSVFRGPNGAQYTMQIQDALQQQAARMEQAAHDERMRREAEATLKRSKPSTDSEQADTKRIKLEHPNDVSGSSSNGSDPLAEFLRNFDFSALPVGLVADIVIANLQILSEASLTSAIEVKFTSFRLLA